MSLISRSFAAWLTIFSLVLNGLLPLAAHAAMKGRPAAMSICSTSGYTQSAQPGFPVKPTTAHSHCTYCCTGTDGTPVLPGHAISLVALVHGTVAHQPAPTAPRANSVFNSAQSRAPPSFCNRGILRNRKT